LNSKRKLLNMKTSLKLLLSVFILVVIFYSCDKPENSELETKSEQEIVYQTTNRELVLQRSVEAIRNSDDEISNHVDSIISGYSNADIISTGEKSFNLDRDSILDISFDIIDLNHYNTNLPDTLDSLAARVHPLNIELLDNSTWGYPDALEFNEEINENGHWDSHENNVLGTFLGIGEFGISSGERYLGIRFNRDGHYNYGWIKLYCSQHNDTLIIIDFAYNTVLDSYIKAGQLE